MYWGIMCEVLKKNGSLNSRAQASPKSTPQVSFPEFANFFDQQSE